MKLVTFETKEGTQQIGAVLPGEQSISNFTQASDANHFHDMLALIDGGERALDEARALTQRPKVEVELADVRLLAPVPVPRGMIDCLCFEEHLLNTARNARMARAAGRETFFGPEGDLIPPVFREIPVYYKGNRFSVVGTGTDIICPKYCRILDYELEFGIFLSRTGKNIPVEEAGDHIFGYCIFNDVSARDKQMSEMRGGLGPSKGKDFDTGNVLGPWLVTPDEIDPRNLTMVARINGEEFSRGCSSTMMHSFPEIIAYSSQDETRHAGEFIGSGTVGTGCGAEHGRFLQHGDVLELEITGLGVQRNRIVFQHDAE